MILKVQKMNSNEGDESRRERSWLNELAMLLAENYVGRHVRPNVLGNRMLADVYDQAVSWTTVVRV